MLILKPRGLDLDQTLDCGQCFRWQRQPEGSWVGVVESRTVRAALTGEGLCIEGLAGPDPEQEPDFWRRYFALDLDYDALCARMRENCPRMAGCIDAAPGIRVLRQPFFEALITFIISQNNNIPRIRAIVGRLCQGLGQELAAKDGTIYHAFPTPQRLARLAPEDLAFLRAGWRAEYILDAARKVSVGLVREEALRRMPLEEARALLRTIQGVGPKVADCTLLYGLGRWEAYPVDVWIRRADQALFSRRVRDPAAYLNRRTGGAAGIAQQYIFAWARTSLIRDTSQKSCKNPVRD